MRPNPQETADSVTFTEKIVNEKLPFFVQWLVLFILILISPETLEIPV